MTRRLAALAALAAVLFAAASVAAQPPNPFDLDAIPKSFADVAEMTAEVVPAKAKRGETVTFKVTVSPVPGAWTYPVHVKDKEQAARSSFAFPPTLLKGVPQPHTLILAAPVTDPPGLQEKPRDPAKPDGPKDEVYKKPVTWEITAVVSPKATPGKQQVTLDFTTAIQVCNKHACFNASPPTASFEVLDGDPVTIDPKYAAEVEKALNPSSPGVNTPSTPASPGETKSLRKTAKPTEQFQADIAGVQQRLDKSGASDATIDKKSGLLGFLATAALWGLITLVTPCVFPMIPITVSIFLKQADNSTRRTLLLAGVYCLTIIVVLGLSAFFLLKLFVDLSVNPWMNLSLCLLFVVFALSLFGMYEVDLHMVLVLGFVATVLVARPKLIEEFGSSKANLILSAVVAVVVGGYYWVRHGAKQGAVLRYLQSQQSGGGVIGTIFGAVAFTIVGFTCVAPFLGGFAGLSASGNFSSFELFLGALAFSTAFAAPFFLLALFPSLLRKLPRSGGWLDSVKVVMGFLELAAALKFLRTAELGWLPQPEYLTYDAVLAGWIAISLACALYLLNTYRLPHDEEKPNIGVMRLMFALMFLGLSVYLTPAIFKGPDGKPQRPSGAVFAWIDAFLLPEPGQESSDLTWGTDLKDALDKAREERIKTGVAKPVFADFTGVTCTNCKYNENNVFPKPAVRGLLEKFERVQLYTDWVPESFFAADPGHRERVLEGLANRNFKTDVFGTDQLPLYVVFLPKVSGGAKVLGVYPEGKINDPDGFAAFLKDMLEKAKQ